MIGKQELEILGVLPEGFLGLFAGCNVAPDGESGRRTSGSFQSRAADFEIDRPAILRQNLDLVTLGGIAIPLPGERLLGGPKVLRRAETGALQKLLPRVSGDGLTG